MIYPSPWRSGAFCDGIALLRRLLRPWGTIENRFIQAMVRIHNYRVRRYIRNSPVESVLLIMPRCLKKSGCEHDVQSSLEACLDCSRCPLGRVAGLTARFGVKALVAHRSHLAYAMARDEKPDLILATACHDRLVKALCSVPEVPTLLTPLFPRVVSCRDADFHLDWLEQQLVRHYRTPATIDREQTPGTDGKQLSLVRSEKQESAAQVMRMNDTVDIETDSATTARQADSS